MSHDQFLRQINQGLEESMTTDFQYRDLRSFDPERGQEPFDGVMYQPTTSRTSIAPPAPPLFDDDEMEQTRMSTPPGPVLPSTPHAPPTPLAPSTPLAEPAEEVRSDFQDVLQEAMHAAEVGNPAKTCTKEEFFHYLHEPSSENDLRMFFLRGTRNVLVVNEEAQDCYILRWKTFSKLQRKGRELDPRYFDEKERKQFQVADAKEWQSFLDTGAVKIIPPEDARTIPRDRIFGRPMRYVRTNKSKDEQTLEAKSRIVTPGDVDPDGHLCVEDGGFKTDASSSILS